VADLRGLRPRVAPVQLVLTVDEALTRLAA